ISRLTSPSISATGRSTISRENSMAGESKRLTTLMALSDFLASEITTANGYKHDLEDRVWRGRNKFDKDDEVPALAILDNPDPDRFPRLAGGDWDYPLGKEDWVLLIQGWVPDDKMNPTDPAYELMADTRK